MGWTARKAKEARADLGQLQKSSLFNHSPCAPVAAIKKWKTVTNIKN